MADPYHTSQDRDYINYRAARDRERWYGVLVKVADEDAGATLKVCLDDILELEGFHLARNRLGHVFCSGAYSRNILDTIGSCIDRHSCDQHYIIEGKYAELLGSSWAEKIIKAGATPPTVSGKR